MSLSNGNNFFLITALQQIETNDTGDAFADDKGEPYNPGERGVVYGNFGQKVSYRKDEHQLTAKGDHERLYPTLQTLEHTLGRDASTHKEECQAGDAEGSGAHGFHRVGKTKERG